MVSSARTGALVGESEESHSRFDETLFWAMVVDVLLVSIMKW